MVFGELWMQGDEMEFIRALAGRRGPHRLRIQHAVADDTQPSRLLSDQDRLSIRQKSDTPWMDQTRRHRHHADPLVSADIKNARRVWILRSSSLLRVVGYYQCKHEQYACACDKRIRPHWNLPWVG